MTTIERAVSAQELFWVKNESHDRIGLIWGIGGVWRWTVGAVSARDAPSFEEALQGVEKALGARVVDIAHRARVA